MVLLVAFGFRWLLAFAFSLCRLLALLAFGFCPCKPFSVMEGSGRSHSPTRRSSRGCLPCCDDADCPINVALRPCPEQVSHISATIPFSVEEAKAPTEATNGPNTENVQYSCHICNEFMLPTCLCLPSEVRVEHYPPTALQPSDPDADMSSSVACADGCSCVGLYGMCICG